MKKNLPIGIFDSGIGGLTVANAIQKTLPNESILYFGDTQHLPYGEKSTEAIQEFSEKITAFLLTKGCKMIVIACNTASSVANHVVEQTAADVPVINVIDPVIDYITSLSTNCRIGVIGTKRTTQTKVYPKKIQQLKPNTQVVSLATPLLAPMVEEGFFNDRLSRTVIESYLNNEALNKIQKLILACTHYPLIQEAIQEYYQGKVEIIDSASQVALTVKHQLENKNLLNNQKKEHRFFVSDYTRSFEQSAKLFFHEKISLEEVKL